MKIVCLLFCMTCFVYPTKAQEAAQTGEPLSERRVAYQMDVTLNPEEKTVAGTQRVTWRNPDQVPVDELQFHLYLNAFRNDSSTFMVESGGSHRGFVQDDGNPWGGIDIERMQIVSTEQSDQMPLGSRDIAGEELTERIRFIHPDDDNLADKTVISVSLDEPVPPGETITLDIDFISRMPQIFARTGWEQKANDSLFFMVAQWFPKLGVYEIPGQRYVPEDAPAGQWSTHQFHANSEFYADFGTYDVTITAPANYLIGASGERIESTANQGLQTVTYRAEDVHDFAWTAGNDLIEFEDQWRGVYLRALLQSEHAGQAQRHFDAAKVGLEYFDQWVGPYPYKTLTLIDGVGGSNGMEYPTLITCGTAYMLPQWVRMLEVVTIHEFGHQYFYGILASNEAEEAWLDEGITSYLEQRIIDEAYGEGSVFAFPWIKVDDSDIQRFGYVANRPESGAIYTKSWEYARRSDYGKASYAKPATVLASLEHHLGWGVMQEALQTYYKEWRFRHPTTLDFKAVLEQAAGEPLDWFFDQYIYGTQVVDYAVDSLSIVSTEGASVQSRFIAMRLGDGHFPQKIRVLFEDGNHELIEWDGVRLKEEFVFERPVAVAEVHLDPEDGVWLDINRLNNRIRLEPEQKFAWQKFFNVTVWVQQWIHLAGSLF